MPRPHQLLKFLLLVIVCGGVCANVQAASLYGKVISVEEGDTFTILNLNRPIKIKLLAVDAPEKDQLYAEIARRHLAELVLERFVSVEYSGLGQNNYIVGKVFLKDMDVGAQMLRDGVAWYDKNSSSQLEQTEQSLYLASEQAARSERRGLWDDPLAVAPWEFKRVQTMRLNNGSYSRPNETKPAAVKKELTNNDLAPKWRQFSSPEGSFQVSTPGQLEEVTQPVTAQSREISMHTFFLNASSATYMVTYIDYSKYSNTSAAINRAFDSGLDTALATGGGHLASKKNISLNGIPGREIVIESVAGVVKIRMYFLKGRLYQLGLAIPQPGAGIEQLSDATANQFFDSFRITKAVGN